MFQQTTWAQIQIPEIALQIQRSLRFAPSTI